VWGTGGGVGKVGVLCFFLLFGAVCVPEFICCVVGRGGQSLLRSE